MSAHACTSCVLEGARVCMHTCARVCVCARTSCVPAVAALLAGWLESGLSPGRRGWLDSSGAGELPRSRARAGRSRLGAALAAHDFTGVGLGGLGRNGAWCPEELLPFLASLFGGRLGRVRAAQTWARGWEPGRISYQHRGPISRTLGAGPGLRAECGRKQGWGRRELPGPACSVSAPGGVGGPGRVSGAGTRSFSLDRLREDAR